MISMTYDPRRETSRFAFAVSGLVEARSATLRSRPSERLDAPGRGVVVMHWKEVAGTLAGDDTVLIITPSRSARAAIQKRMEEMLR